VKFILLGTAWWSSIGWCSHVLGKVMVEVRTVATGHRKGKVCKYWQWSFIRSARAAEKENKKNNSIFVANSLFSMF